uniref:Glycine-rich RNA-binding protein 4 n=1 Tax=Rhizophora mucronata TaxID=61149 RepID=A0A2P2L3C8_RHIMU
MSLPGRSSPFPIYEHLCSTNHLSVICLLWFYAFSMGGTCYEHVCGLCCAHKIETRLYIIVW